MEPAVADDRHAGSPVGDDGGRAVDRDRAHRAGASVRILDRDVVPARAAGEPEIDAIPRPRVRDPGPDDERLAALERHAEDRLERDAVHPARGPRVPGPPAAPDVR